MRSITPTTILFAGGLFLSGCSTSAPEGKVPAEGTDADTTATNAMSHVCPMHPEETGKQGDTCPKCGMDLEPVN